MFLSKLHGIMAEFFHVGKQMRIRNILITILCLALVASCTSYDFQRRVVQQGNLIPHAKIERLKIGMNKQDVAILMGTSLISPLFDNNRWDYAYTWRKGNRANCVKNVSIYFKHDRVVKIVHHP